MFMSVVCIIKHKRLEIQIHKFLYSIEFGTVTDCKLAWSFSVSVNLVVSEEHGASFIVRMYKGTKCTACIG